MALLSAFGQLLWLAASKKLQIVMFMREEMTAGCWEAKGLGKPSLCLFFIFIFFLQASDARLWQPLVIKLYSNVVDFHRLFTQILNQ